MLVNERELKIMENQMREIVRKRTHLQVDLGALEKKMGGKHHVDFENIKNVLREYVELVETYARCSALDKVRLETKEEYIKGTVLGKVLYKRAENVLG